MNHSDTEVEMLLFGKWRFNTNWEKISIHFKDDMTYEQTKIQTFFLYKTSEIITGNKFAGVWYVNDRRLCLVVKNLPKSGFNLQLFFLSTVYLADMIASLGSIFITEKYEIVEINSSLFTLKNKNEIITGLKIK
ncbi:hypothetical protein H6G76_30065 [Nostoc sp. FACHB-152]|uniref:hypothetical protein n=1 Tax=unclassified Nostoc TaxID=2593658 RepID=UPI001682E08D|nr:MULTISPECIES: hypothetical protein [unclassified Nostoc]MBD2451298.1 hypothetical protein [Nostoc sp. FACHB-152]MBD2466927.1 hypothetical protein [Nostoc sp. FACHB-145]